MTYALQLLLAYTTITLLGDYKNSAVSTFERIAQKIQLSI